MWERSLQDLIRGLRSHKTSSKAELDAFLEEAMVEIRAELKGKDMDLKAEGVVKMCYLMMLHPLAPPPSFPFHVVEVMSSQRYHLKQLGYVAAPMAFSFDTEEVVLTVNGIRKDLLASHAHLPPLALMGLSDIVTPALARDVYADVATLTTHSRPHVRKRAVLALFRIFERYPDAMRMGFSRLRDRLEDDDPGVVSATVNVITELSRKSNPKNFLPLAPQLFELLTTSSNNWMLIKIVKLFATLTPIEPRLVRKLLPPITNLISTTPAISLLYECVRTCITGGMLEGRTEAGDALARVCVEKLSIFLSDEDQNLKYIALLAMVKIVPTHPHLISDYQDEILQSLDDEDVSIRMRALELISSMVNRRNLKEIVTELLSHLVPKETKPASRSNAASLLAQTADPTASGVNATSSPNLNSPAYRLELSQRILDMTSVDTYDNVADFEWYISVLIDLAYVAKAPIGSQLRASMLDVVSRVDSLRGYSVQLCRRILNDEELSTGSLEGDENCSEVVYAAAWICGEDGSVEDAPRLIRDLLPNSATESASTTAVRLMAVAKVFGRWAAEISTDWNIKTRQQCLDLIDEIFKTLDEGPNLTELVVHERASNMSHLFTLIRNDVDKSAIPTGRDEIPEGMAEGFAAQESDSAPTYPKSLFLLLPLFDSYELNPVGYKAQERVSLPEGLNLDLALVDPALLEEKSNGFDAESDDQDEPDMDTSENMVALQAAIKASEGSTRPKKAGKGPRVKADGTLESKEERTARRVARKARQAGNPHYLAVDDDLDDVDDIPIVKLEIDGVDESEQLDQDGLSGRRLLSATAGGSKSPRRPGTPLKVEVTARPEVQVDRQGEMPEGSRHGGFGERSDRSAKRSKTSGGLRALDIDMATNDGDRPGPSTRPGGYRDYEPDSPVRTEERILTPPVEVVQVVTKKKKKKKRAVLDDEGGTAVDPRRDVGYSMCE